MSAQTSYGDLSKADLVEILDIVTESVNVASEDRFAELYKKVQRVLPIRGGLASVTELDSRGAIVRTTRHINMAFPEKWLKMYQEQQLAAIDPIAKNLYMTNEPILWSETRANDRSANSKMFFGLAEENGIVNALSFGAKFKAISSGSYFTCAGDALSNHPRHLAVIYVLIPHLHAAFAKVHTAVMKDRPSLSVREVEVLNWAKFGKTNWEISLQLNLSERAVKFHIENAIRKLGASNRSQAVAAALSHGMITWG